RGVGVRRGWVGTRERGARARTARYDRTLNVCRQAAGAETFGGAHVTEQIRRAGARGEAIDAWLGGMRIRGARCMRAWRTATLSRGGGRLRAAGQRGGEHCAPRSSRVA